MEEATRAALEQLAARYGWTRGVVAEVSALVTGELAALTHSGPALPDRREPALAPGGTQIGGALGIAGPAAAALEGLPERYVVLGPLGAGGMGAVWRVRDMDLGRTLALKVLHERYSRRRDIVARFVEEAQITAQLQHPGVVPLYDLGRLPDGRLFFTMKEVQGRTLDEVIRAVHAASTDGAWLPERLGWTFRRLVKAFVQVCEAVAYAHSRGVLHRDLKPGNVMVGEFGEVMVLDWGLAKICGASEQLLQTDRSGAGAYATVAGAVTGTPAYMAPEQASGHLEQLDERSEVYALGAILYEILAGRPAFGGQGDDVLAAVKAGSVPPVPRRRRAPEALLRACSRAMSLRQQDRFPDAGALAAAVKGWLDGALRREKALNVIDGALALGPEAARRRQVAAELRAEIKAARRQVGAWEPVAKKLPIWLKEDRAEAMERAADLMELRRVAGLQSALNHAPDLPEAHAALAETYLNRFAAAEARRDPGAAARAETLLEAHLEALPGDHPVRARAARWLEGEGALTLYTDPPGAEVRLYRYRSEQRRLVPEFQRVLGRSPLVDVPLKHGSYLLEIQGPSGPPVPYPVAIGRGERWDGRTPEGEQQPIWLPPGGTLGPDEVVVPAGWYWSGGDRAAFRGLPGRRLWVDGLVVQRFQVTNAQLLDFLNDLLAQGREEEALRHVPRERASVPGGLGSVIYHRDDSGRFCLGPDADGDVWDPRWPVMHVSWHGARAYAAWYAARTGQPWRLPYELEWEKVARGVDGRAFPWGDYIDPTFACVHASHPPGAPHLPAVIDSFPVDESPYGVRGLGGNVRDWCLDRYREEGPPCPDGWVSGVLEPDGPGVLRVGRGGSWDCALRDARAASRMISSSGWRSADRGFRLVRSIQAPER